MTRLALEYKEVANVHLDAVEHKDTVVFLHGRGRPGEPKLRPAGRRAADVPPVIRQAKKYLQLLEDASLARGNQEDLFSTKVREEPEPAPIRCARSCRR